MKGPEDNQNVFSAAAVALEQWALEAGFREFGGETG
jgi:hypothetical protein